MEERKCRGDHVGQKALRNTSIIIAEETKEVNRKLKRLKDSYNSLVGASGNEGKKNSTCKLSSRANKYISRPETANFQLFHLQNFN